MATVTSDRSRSKVFFFAAGGREAVDAIDAFALRPWDALSFRPFGPVYRQLSDRAHGTVRVWGFRDTPSNRRAWGRLLTGDMGLGYAKGVYRVASTLLLTAYSREVGRQVFGEQAPDDAYTLLAFFDGTTQTEISRSEIANALGYSDKFVPRGGLFIPAEQRQRFVRDAYGTPDRFVRALEAGVADAKIPPAEPSTGTPSRSRRPYIESDPGLPTAEELVLTDERTRPPVGARGPYARLDAPGIVAVGEPFRVIVGLAPDRNNDYSGGLFDRHGLGSGSSLDVRVVADGFKLADGSWRNQLLISDDEPYPVAALRLQPTRRTRGSTDGATPGAVHIGRTGCRFGRSHFAYPPSRCPRA